MSGATSAKIVVIGSNAFSGASFARYCAERGAAVIGISRSAEPHPAFLPYRWSEAARAFRFYRYDLNHDLADIVALIDRERPDYVVNFAAQSMVGESWTNPEHWFQTNVVATVKLHDALRRRDFLRRYVHVTTPEVYGSVSGPVRETTGFNPSTPYAVSRAAADMSLRTFFDAYGFPVILTRAANVYGPGQQLYRIIPRTILSIRLRRKLGLQGGGRSTRSFIHIDDVSAATWRLMQDGQSGETYHISTEHFVTIRQLVEQLCDITGAVFEDVVEMTPDRLGKDAQYALDSHKLRDTLGWRDEIPLSAGLRDCVAWVDRNLPVLREQPMDYVHKP
jgi:dTDP-glucose 4,6-dehydratase